MAGPLSKNRFQNVTCTNSGLHGLSAPNEHTALDDAAEDLAEAQLRHLQPPDGRQRRGGSHNQPLQIRRIRSGRKDGAERYPASPRQRRRRLCQLTWRAALGQQLNRRRHQLEQSPRLPDPPAGRKGRGAGLLVDDLRRDDSCLCRRHGNVGRLTDLHRRCVHALLGRRRKTRTRADARGIAPAFHNPYAVELIL